MRESASARARGEAKPPTVAEPGGCAMGGLAPSNSSSRFPLQPPIALYLGIGKGAGGGVLQTPVRIALVHTAGIPPICPPPSEFGSLPAPRGFAASQRVTARSRGISVSAAGCAPGRGTRWEYLGG